MTDFKQKTIQSFQQARSDHEQLKDSTDQWVNYLEEQNQHLQYRIAQLEAKISGFELVMSSVLDSKPKKKRN